MVGWMCWGFTDRQIGAMYHLSHRTVKNCIDEARRETFSKTRPMLARWYVLNVELPLRYGLRV
jgi:hypothetical protein